METMLYLISSCVTVSIYGMCSLGASGTSLLADAHLNTSSPMSVYLKKQKQNSERLDEMACGSRIECCIRKLTGLSLPTQYLKAICFLSAKSRPYAKREPVLGCLTLSKSKRHLEFWGRPREP